MTHLIELCGGSAALTLYLNEQEPLLSYAGNKRSYAIDLIRLLNIKTPLQSFHINEPGLWFDIHSGLQEHSSRIADAIDCYSDPKTVFMNSCASLLAHSDGNLVARATSSILKLAGTFGSHEVGGFKGCNPLRQKDGFSPSRHTIKKRVMNYKPIPNLTLTNKDAALIKPYSKGIRTICYMDVPYVGKEGSYVNRFHRLDIIRVALLWKDSGADVYISEATPIHSLVEMGWKCSLVKSKSHTNYRVRRHPNEEWLTYFEQSK